MNLSLSLLLTLLFLAPGFAGYFGFLIAVSGRSVRRAPPPPNSITFLVVISFIALAAHSVALLLFALQDAFCLGGGCVAVSFEPDAYARLGMMLRAGGTQVRSSAIFYEIFWLVALSVATFLAARGVTWADLRRRERSYIAAQLYRWLGPHARDVRSGEAVVTAYVLTKMRHDGMAIGYRGIVNEVSLNADGEINSITLYAVERFGLLLGATVSPDRRVPALSGLLGLVHIPGREIENVALTAFTFADAEAAEPTDGAGSEDDR